ncbi:putative peptidoglycan glycosyltransferase FtsW [Ruminococcus sp.]|uniref:FtsW/RodA/SpoVE family cell cycle protein n=1 Tax=Ruminococcus sp. TaxID=41978 RepID=UPI00259100EA|nr:putative peptidoglycan glycosyltransferase FtsW [Ruminococcus sp.]MCR5022055.1 putative lipid II flippase FtsW [Ruminococcus sp.]
MADKGIYRDRDGGLTLNNHLLVRQPVAQARKKLNFNFKSINKGVDMPFLLLILMLLGFGVLMMFSASYAWGINDMGDGYYYAKKQLTFAGIGLVGMLFVSMLDYHFFQNTAVCYLFFGVMYVMCLYAAFFGSSTADASRWINLGFVQFQPSELLKVSFIIIFAYIMAVNFPKFNNWKYCVIPFTVIMGLSVIVLGLQRHLSAVLIIGIIGVSMMFVSGMPAKTFWKFIGILAAVALLGLAILLMAGKFSYIQERIDGWRNPEADIQNNTWQTYNSLVAIGSGGWFGLGFGESRQKFLYLPEAQNDFVFAIICEELGFVGALVVVVLFVIFVLRGFYIASNAKDRFGMLVAAGITIQIGIQAFLNIMVASNSFPNTGISLPFFSYGGTALIIQLAEMGILLSISRQGNIKK